MKGIAKLSYKSLYRNRTVTISETKINCFQTNNWWRTRKLYSFLSFCANVQTLRFDNREYTAKLRHREAASQRP